MIERIVLVKLDDAHATSEGRASVAAHTKHVLSEVPGVTSVSVGVPCDERAAQSWDLSIVVGFRRYDDVQPYLQHPAHREYVDTYLSPKLAVIKAWNFETA